MRWKELNSNAKDHTTKECKPKNSIKYVDKHQNYSKSKEDEKNKHPRNKRFNHKKLKLSKKKSKWLEKGCNNDCWNRSEKELLDYKKTHKEYLGIDLKDAPSKKKI